MDKWNYRIGTKLQKHMLRSEETRNFFVIEVYYDKKLKPYGFHDGSHLAAWNNFKDLKMTHGLIAGAFRKPIIDLDDFPKVYKGKK